MDADYSVEVVVRKRPVREGEADSVECPGRQVLVHEEKVKVDLTRYMHTHDFSYDASYGEDDDTEVLYQQSVAHLVANVFEGGTSTCFCFGQTASGKTFTLFGAGGGQYAADRSIEDLDPAEGGVYLLAAQEIFARAAACGAWVALSMYEIYGQKLHDLLDERKELTALEDGNGVLQLVGLTQHRCVGDGGREGGRSGRLGDVVARRRVRWFAAVAISLPAVPPIPSPLLN